LPPILISTILQSGKFLNLARYFPYDVKLRLLAHSLSFLANRKARNAIVGAENLLNIDILGRKTVVKLLGNLLWIQEKLLEQNPDTKNILHPGEEASKSTAHGSDEDEEIPSDTEDEKSDDDNDDGADSADDQLNGDQAESSLKLPAKRKHELVSCCVDFFIIPVVTTSTVICQFSRPLCMAR